MIQCDDADDYPRPRHGSSEKPVQCCVPHCTGRRGSRKGDPLPDDLTGYSWICAKHWARVPGRVKARRRCLEARERKVRRKWWARSHRAAYTAELHDRFRRVHDMAIRQRDAAWQACINAACEAAAGI